MFDDPRKGTAVAALGSSGAMVILTYILFLLHVDVPGPVVAAITGLLGSIAGLWAHSTTVREDRAALHKLILAHLGDQSARAVVFASPVPLAPADPLPQRSAADMLKGVRS